MELTVDVTELRGYADAMAQAPGVLNSEMETASRVLLHEGIGYAQEYVPRDSGNLAGSIVIMDGPSAAGGAYGSSMVYAWQREKGGTIHARNKPYLHFQLPDGRWVKVKSVTQSGSHYMQKSMERLEPRVDPVYQLAIDRTLGRI